MWTRLEYWGIAAVLSVSLLVLVYWGDGAALFFYLNQLNFPFHDTWWSGLTVFGDTVVVVTLCLPLVIRAPRLVWTLVIAGVLAALVIRVGKVSLFTLRPAGVFAVEDFHLIGLAHKRGAFPSGHSATIAVFVAGCFIALRHSGQWLLPYGLLLVAALVAISRVMVGAHWPTDVVAGVIVGWLAIVPAGYISARFFPAAVRNLLPVLLLACTANLLFAHDTGYPRAYPLVELVALTCLFLSLHLINWRWRVIQDQVMAAAASVYPRKG